MGSGEAESSPFSPATTPELKGPCQDLDPAELGSSAAVSVLGAPDENEPLALVPGSQSDILDEETQQRRDAECEGDGGNTSPHKQDDAEGPVTALSDNEEEIVRSINKDPSPCLSQGSAAAKSKLTATMSLTVRALDQTRVLGGRVLPSGSNHSHMSMAE